MRRRIAAPVLALGLLAAGAAPASAAPVDNRSPHAGDVLTLDCSDGQQLVIVAPPNDSDFTPGFVVGTHRVVVPYAFTFTTTFDGVTETGTMVKRAPVPAGALTCTFGDTFTDPDTGKTGSFRVIVVAVVRGART